ncbi:hypothetical protein [Enterovibrio baiacu]|uniref:hypothetical protein n=1 Tax=Enterovibrio baiacu TaxID=2491023 RepID=UPI003D0A526E
MTYLGKAPSQGMRMSDPSEKQNEELQRLELQKKRLEYEKLMLEVEGLKAGKGGSTTPWFDGRWFQACIAGVVAGALIWAFAIDHIKKLYDIQNELRKDQTKLELEIQNHEKENAQLQLSLSAAEDTINQLWAQANKPCVRPDDGSLSGPKPTDDAAIVELSKSLVSISEIAKAPAVIDTWFPVIASAYRKIDLTNKLEELGKLDLEHNVAVYKTTDKKGTIVWAITLGGYMSKSDAQVRVDYARKAQIAPDAYVWKSEKWGKNIIGDFR